jgi:uncharacterized membrane protein
MRLTEDDEDDQTPLEEKLDNLAKLIGKGGILFSIATFIVLLVGWLIRKSNLLFIIFLIFNSHCHYGRNTFRYMGCP